MGFKTDREFLRNLTVGLVGARKVAEMMETGGCQIICVDRASRTNKVWSGMKKRSRFPDLLCLNCGRRIESRAKSELRVTMSHSPNNPQRYWNKGLRDCDLVACIKCDVSEDLSWEASDELTLFTVGSLRATEHLAKPRSRKAASEGAEQSLEWPASVPKQPGEVVEVTERVIRARLASGRHQSYQLRRRRNGEEILLHPHVNLGDHFGAGSRVIASVMRDTAPVRCPGAEQRDDFISDLRSNELEIVYGAVKALGHLPDLRALSIDPLQVAMTTHADVLVRLEAAASLIRLNDERGWTTLETAAKSDNDNEVRMESVLILSELPGRRSADILAGIARQRANPSELRAAAGWGMGTAASSIESTPLLELVTDSDETTAVHSIVAAGRLMTEETLPGVIAEIGRDARRSAGIVRALQIARCDPLPHALARLRTADASTRNWLIYLMATLGRERCTAYLTAHAPDLLEELEFFWQYHNENWTNRLDIADETDFLLGQVLD